MFSQINMSAVDNCEPYKIMHGNPFCFHLFLYDFCLRVKATSVWSMASVVAAFNAIAFFNITHKKNHFIHPLSVHTMCMATMLLTLLQLSSQQDGNCHHIMMATNTDRWQIFSLSFPFNLMTEGLYISFFLNIAWWQLTYFSFKLCIPAHVRWSSWSVHRRLY